MNQFLIKHDFEILIREGNLDELTDNIDKTLFETIDVAVEEVACYIRHRYDESIDLKKIQSYTNDTEFIVDDRIYWEESDWVSANTYSSGDRVNFTDDYIWIANATTSTGESPSTTPGKWDKSLKNKTFYYCILDSTGNLPSNATYFTAGDNRNKKLKMVAMDVTLYHLHSAISPRDIPEIRQIRYDGMGKKDDGENAIMWLEKVQKGRITPNLTAILDDDDEEIQNTNPVSWGHTPTASFKY